MIYSNTTHSFGIDRKSNDTMMSNHTLARAHCYPKGEWFFIALGGSKDETRITWEEWERIVAKVKELHEISQKAIRLEDPTK
jgi:hypothetical protein